MELNKYQKKWLDALRSGKYEKGTGRLSQNGKFCCLGVACEVLLEELEIKKEIDLRGVVIYNEDDCYLYNPVFRKLGIGAKGDFIKPVLGESSITRINDFKEGLSFPEIADIIEENILNDNFVNP